MKPGDIRELTTDEITQRIGQLQEEMFRLRFRSATMELENPMLMRNIRRDIARLNTILRERQMAGEGAGR
jgi:large subunit ribosomal protein L29